MDLGYSLEEFLLMPPVFIEIPLFIGDCIRNLRSALDYLVSELAREANISDKHTVFPFSEDPSGLKASFNRPVPGQQHRKGRKAGPLYDLSRQYPNLEKVILTDIQPYSAAHGAHPMGDLLWRIITSDNIDKHRLMTPSIQQLTEMNVLLNNGGRISGGATVIGNAIRFAGGQKLDKNSNFALDIIFSEPARLSGKPVMSTLIEGCNMVGEVIKIFRREFPQPITIS